MSVLRAMPAPAPMPAGRSLNRRFPAMMVEPLKARTRSIHRPIGPAAYDCVQLVVVRDGTAIVFSEFGEQPVSFGDAILLGPNVLCGIEPECGSPRIVEGFSMRLPGRGPRCSRN